MTVPSNVLAKERGRIIRAILTISSSETLPSCLTEKDRMESKKKKKIELTILLFLSVSWWFFQGFDDK